MRLCNNLVPSSSFPGQYTYKVKSRVLTLDETEEDCNECEEYK